MRQNNDLALWLVRLCLCIAPTPVTVKMIAMSQPRSYFFFAIQPVVVWSLLGLLGISATAEESSTSPWSSFQNSGRPIAAADQLPTVWSPTSGIAWTTSIEGYGQSTPVVGHQQVVVTSTSGSNKDRYHLASFAIDSGEKLWQVDLDNPSPFANTPMVSRAAPTPIATQTGFVAWFEGGLVVAVSASGSVQWKQDLTERFGKIEARHGLAGSLEQNDSIVFVWVERSDEPYLVAMDKQTGEIVWKVPGIGATSWASPRLIAVGDGYHLVCSGSGKIVGYDPASGERLWQFENIANNSSCTPMPVGQGRFLIGASDGRGESASSEAAASNGLIEIQRQESGAYSVDFVWRAEKATCTFGSPIVAGDNALFVNRVGVLYQLDLKTGRQLSADRTGAGGIWATPIVAGELVYLFGHQGNTSVVSLANGAEVAVNRAWIAATEKSQDGSMPSGSVLYAATVTDQNLLLRTGDRLYAIAKSTDE